MNTLTFPRLARALLPYLLLWTACAAVLATIAVVEIRESYARETADVHASLDSVTGLVREHASRSIDAIDRPLALLQRMRSQGATDTELHTVLRALRTNGDLERRFKWMDRDGAYVDSSDPVPIAKRYSVADRPFFKRAAGPDGPRELIVDAPVITRSTNTAGVPLARRLETPDGEFEGVVVSALEISRLQAIYGALRIGRDFAAGLVGRDGLVYAVSGASDLAPRSNAIDTDLATPGLGGSGETALIERRVIDGVGTFAAFRPIPGTPMVAFAAVGEDAALGAYYRTQRNVLGFAAIALFALTVPILLLGARSFRDLTRRDNLEVRYRAERELARTDSLTGVANRVAFGDRHARVHADLGKDGTGYVLAFIDVDRFKRLNDRRGHAAGDAALQQIAAVLAHGIRGSDFVARLGGDEFALVMPGCMIEDAGTVLKRLHAALDGASTRADLDLGFSIGAVGVVDPALPLQAVVSFADTLMYSVKAEGGGVRMGAYRNGALALIDADASSTMRNAA